MSGVLVGYFLKVQVAGFSITLILNKIVPLARKYNWHIEKGRGITAKIKTIYFIHA